MKLRIRARALALALILLAGCASAPRVPTPLPDSSLSELSATNLPLRVDWISPVGVPPLESPVFHPLEYAQPLVDGGRIFVGATNGTCFALNARNGVPVWKFQAFGPVEGQPVAAGGVVAFGDSDGMVYGIDRSTGFAKWTFQLGGEVMGGGAYDGKYVYVATSYNRVYAVDAATGAWKWMYQRDLSATFSVRGVATPVLQNGVLYAGFSDGYVAAIDTKTGKEIWKNLLKIDERLADVDASPLVEGDALYIAAYDGALYKLGLASGEVVWKSDRVGGISRPASVGEYLIVASSRGFVYAVSKSEGTQMWETDIRHEDKAGSVARAPRIRIKVPTAPTVFGNAILTTSNEGFLYALDARIGSVRWRFHPGLGASSGFARDENRIYFLANGGNLYAMSQGAPESVGP
ncbi:MAG: PQQ-binding-like beta-propeller repeat protein [Deltaproteobacteria bacterium]|nr:PQQ-binding-like beta-propeller repeat protein [Deltaproteobacteria bacterium]